MKSTLSSVGEGSSEGSSRQIKAKSGGLGYPFAEGYAAVSQVMNYLPQTLQLPHLRRATSRTSCVLEWFLFSKSPEH